MSKGQVDCLRLAGEGLQTKEIAKELTMSAGRVDKQILAARQKLGGMTRREAGRLVLEWTGGFSAFLGGGHSLGAQPMPLPAPVIFTPSKVVDHEADAPGPAGTSFADGQAAYAVSSAKPDRFELVPLRHSGRRSNDLTSKMILVTIAKLTLGALVLVGSAVSLLSSLSRLAEQ